MGIIMIIGYAVVWRKLKQRDSTDQGGKERLKTANGCSALKFDNETLLKSFKIWDALNKEYSPTSQNAKQGDFKTDVLAELNCSHSGTIQPQVA